MCCRQPIRAALVSSAPNQSCSVPDQRRRYHCTAASAWRHCPWPTGSHTRRRCSDGSTGCVASPHSLICRMLLLRAVFPAGAAVAESPKTARVASCHSAVRHQICPSGLCCCGICAMAELYSCQELRPSSTFGCCSVPLLRIGPLYSECGILFFSAASS